MNKKEKSVEGVPQPETALSKVQTWTANSERDHWSLVTWLLEVFGHTYSETNVALKVPDVEITRAAPPTKRKEAQNLSSIGLRWRDFPRLIEESNEEKIDGVKDFFWKPIENYSNMMRIN